MSTVHHQEYIHAIGIFHANSVGCLLAWSRWILTTLACIQCWDTPDDGWWTCPKHVKYFIK